MNAETELELEGSDDSSDEDYNPAAGGNVSVSEEESDGELSDGPTDEVEENGSRSTKRRKTSTSKHRKKMKNGIVKDSVEKEEEKENSETVELVSEEDKKKKSDLLWADFLRDCGPPPKKTQPLKSETESEPQGCAKTAENEVKPTPDPKKITQVLIFAGEEVKVEKTVVEEPIKFGTSGRGIGRGRRRGGAVATGIGSLLSQIGKKGKLSTLEKSKLDWERFKDEQGIKEDLESHNKGKDGYLERQDFLERTDHRQFEIEKQMRSHRRTLNR